MWKLLKLLNILFYFLFDDSMNKVLQVEKINLRIRFWDNTAKQVCIWFFDSHFLKWSNAANLLNSLLLSVKGVIAKHMLQLAMDILNIYWDVLQLIYENYSEKEYSQEIKICSLNKIMKAV